MAVNEADKELYVLKIAPLSYRIDSYSLNGTHLKTDNLNLPSIPNKFIYHDEKFFFLGKDALSNEMQNRYQWIEADAHTLDITYFKSDTDSLYNQDLQGTVGFGRKVGNQLLYWNLYNDTIYKIKNNSYDTPYI